MIQYVISMCEVDSPTTEDSIRVLDEGFILLKRIKMEASCGRSEIIYGYHIMEVQTGNILYLKYNNGRE